jgi:hypothetical protein
VPRRIQAAVRGTLGRLSAVTRPFLETAAVLGRSFRLEDTAEMLGTSPAALLPAVDEALAAGVLVTAQDALAFRHQLVWQAVSETLPPPVAQALHRQIGEILLARGGSAASAAAHLLSSASRGDAAALAGLDRAAAEVPPSSPAIAADLASRALELTPPGDPELIHRSVAAAEALTVAGRLAAATELRTWAMPCWRWNGHGWSSSLPQYGISHSRRMPRPRVTQGRGTGVRCFGALARMTPISSLASSPFPRFTKE